MSETFAPETVLGADVAAAIRGIVTDVLKLHAESITIDEDTNLYELGLESLNVVELLTQIEISFDVTIDVEDLSAELFGRFGTLVAFVRRKIDESR
jgi:acyl carrier protein